MLAKLYCWACVYWVLRSEARAVVANLSCVLEASCFYQLILTIFTSSGTENYSKIASCISRWFQKPLFEIFHASPLKYILIWGSQLMLRYSVVFTHWWHTDVSCGETVEIPPAVRGWPETNILLVVSLLLASVYVLKGSTVLGKLFSFLQKQVMSLGPAVQWSRSYPYSEVFLNFGWSLSHVCFYHEHQLVPVILYLSSTRYMTQINLKGLLARWGLVQSLCRYSKCMLCISWKFFFKDYKRCY